jgi:dTMP kinase
VTVAFIVMEGGEGVGKSTQVELLVERLRALGHDVDQTREPGGTPEGVKLRERLLHDPSGVGPEEELDLMLQDRALHIEQRIKPALARGAIVVCDRFSPSTIAYQGVARGMGVEYVEARCLEVAAGTEPEVVVVLDLPDEVAEARVSGARDRFERAGADFHAAVRNAYRDLAGDRGWVIVDASGSPEAVAARVWAVVEPLVARDS